MTARRLEIIDAGRGLAALLVLIHHLNIFFPSAFDVLLGISSPARRALDGISDLNTEAVMLFFVISGFCIRKTSLALDFSRPGDLYNYAQRRAVRIVPCYYLAIAMTFVIGVAMGISGGASFSFANLGGNLAFLQAPATAAGTWFVPYGDNGPLWSISFEVFYYILFPAVAVLEVRRLGGDRVEGKVKGLALSFLFSWTALLLNHLLPNPLFLFASLYAVWHIGVIAFDARENRALVGPALAVLTCAIVAMCAARLVRQSDTLSLLIEGSLIGAAWLLLQAAPGGARLLRFRLLAEMERFFAVVGRFSYGLYLVHYPVIALTVYVLGDTLLAIVVAVMVSGVFAVFTEGSGLLLKNWLFSRASSHSSVRAGLPHRTE